MLRRRQLALLAGTTDGVRVRCCTEHAAMALWHPSRLHHRTSPAHHLCSSCCLHHLISSLPASPQRRTHATAHRRIGNSAGATCLTYAPACASLTRRLLAPRYRVCAGSCLLQLPAFLCRSRTLGRCLRVPPPLSRARELDIASLSTSGRRDSFCPALCLHIRASPALCRHPRLLYLQPASFGKNGGKGRDGQACRRLGFPTCAKTLLAFYQRCLARAPASCVCRGASASAASVISCGAVCSSRRVPRAPHLHATLMLHHLAPFYTAGLGKRAAAHTAHDAHGAAYILAGAMQHNWRGCRLVGTRRAAALRHWDAAYAPSV
jgi:hypothetical protein